MSDVLKGNVLIERLLEQALNVDDGLCCPQCEAGVLTIDDLGDMLVMQCGVCGWLYIEEDDECDVLGEELDVVEMECCPMTITVAPDLFCHPSF